MRVNVIVTQEYEIEIDDKFKVMDLPECDDGWDKIPTELMQELVSTAREALLTCDPVDVEEVEEIYNPEGEVLYRQGWM
jgi:hypothetical protein